MICCRMKELTYLHRALSVCVRAGVNASLDERAHSLSTEALAEWNRTRLACCRSEPQHSSAGRDRPP